MDRLDQSVIARWREAATDLGIRVTAPIELSDRAGERFFCEVLVHDFGSSQGAIFVSRRTERRVRARLRATTPPRWFAIESPYDSKFYVRKYKIATLLDLGWFGEAGAEPPWYAERMPR